MIVTSNQVTVVVTSSGCSETPVLTLSVNPTTITAGNIVYVSGNLSCGGNAIPNASVKITYNYQGTTSSSCYTFSKTATTDSSGNYVIGISISCTGTWIITASYGNISSTPSEVELTVTGTAPSNYGLVCSGGVYRCVAGAGNLTLQQCESNSLYGKQCGRIRYM